MEFTKIAGIQVPVYKNANSSLIYSSNLVETDTTLKNLRNILYPVIENQPVLLVGDAGVGKNALIYYINAKRNHPTLRYSFNEDTLPEDLIGSYRLLMSGNGFEWINGPIVNAIASGYTFVADEMNLCSPNVIKRFATVYESNYIDIMEGDGSRIQAKEGFSFIGTQNPSEGFEGRKPLPFDITKNFSTVFVDPYPPDEILFILKKLYPELTESLLQICIRVTLATERKVLNNELGKGDLEKYHFNIRTLKKVCERLNAFNCNDKYVVYRELSHLYIEPFRKEEDKNSQLELIRTELQYSDKEISHSVKMFVEGNKLYCNDKSIHTEESISKRILTEIPVTEKILTFMEKVVTGIQLGENILIEFGEEDDPNFLMSLITNISGLRLSHVNLCKGIHTSDILGALKPVSQSKVEWVDGPLTKGIREGGTIVITALEAAGAELVEKLNMLTDDAKAITLPPESGETNPIHLKEDSRVYAFKMFRKTKSIPTISRAFRNRFTPVLFPSLEDEKSLKEILQFYLPDDTLSGLMTTFHTKIKTLSQKRVIGSGNLNPYLFGLSNLLKWKDHIVKYNAPETLVETVVRGAKISYINQISDPKERFDMERLIDTAVKSKSFPDDLYQKIEDKKKTFTDPVNLDRNPWWDPELHKREANTGKAPLKNSGSPLKKGIEINTPETGGNTKEGADAWYGKDTQGNMGQGEPAGGGGAWGYRTEELYKQFLAKRKILWNYSMAVSLKEFKEVFEKSLEEVEMNLESLFDPEVDITRIYQTQGKRVDTRKYISFKSGRGDSKVFDKTIIDKNEEKLKGVEIVFLVSKARRIFNFEYSVATLSAMLTSAYILNEHSVKFSIYSYSDRLNKKDHIDLICLKDKEDEYDMRKEEEMFNSLTRDWQGDSVYEFSLIENCEKYFSSEAETRIIVIISDFRGQRGKTEIDREIDSWENKKLKEEVLKNTKKNYVFLAVGLGNRYIAENLFENSVQITADNFANMPNLIGTELTKLIHIHHAVR